jgi:hypothetical protein
LRQQHQALQERFQALEGEIVPLKEENARLSKLAAQTAQTADRSNEVYRRRDEVTRLRADARARSAAAPMNAAAADPLHETLQSLGERAAKLRDAVNRMPERSIPELQYLKEKDWIDAVAFSPKLETEEEYREAFNQLRMRAKSTVGHALQGALQKYMEANDNRMPESLAALAPNLEQPLAPEIFDRYRLTQPGGTAVTDRNTMLIEEIGAPVDDEYESRFSFSLNGTTSRTFSRIGEVLEKAAEAYAKANGGLLPRDSSQLTGYLQDPIDSARIQKFLARIPPDVTTLEQMKKR